jgi:hypothetical protein
LVVVGLGLGRSLAVFPLSTLTLRALAFVATLTLAGFALAFDVFRAAALALIFLRVTFRILGLELEVIFFLILEGLFLTFFNASPASCDRGLASGLSLGP